MTTQSRLILFTLSYPYSSAAESNFLTPELEVLGQHFEVIIVPRSTSGTLEPLPAGCVLDDSFARLLDQPFARRFRRFLRLIRWSFFAELLAFFPKSLDPRLFARVVGDYFLMSYARTWARRTGRRVITEGSIFYGWWLTPEILSLAAMHSRTQIPAVARGHGGDLYEFRDSPPGKPFRRRHINSLTKLWPDSMAGVGYIRGAFPELASRTNVGYLGTPDFGLSPFDKSTRVVRIVTCSFIDPIKQLELALGGILEMARQRPSASVEWVHVGNGKPEDIFCHFEEAPQNFNFVHLPYPGLDGLREFYLNSTVTAFLNTSASEGVPVAMMEAASCGIPLIGPAIGGVPEIVQDGINGCLMKHGASVEAVRDSIEKILQLPHDAYLEMRRASREVWKCNFNSMRNFEDFRLELEKLCR